MCSVSLQQYSICAVLQCQYSAVSDQWELEVFNYFNDLLSGTLVVFKNLIISQRPKHIMHTIFK